MTRHTRIAVALDGVGWHPAAHLEESADAQAVTTLPYWRRLIGEAERGGVDFVTIEDSFLPPVGANVPGRLDALLIASAVAPSTSRIGLVPTVTVTHTEPFHVATGLQTLDHVSRGRAGWRLQVSPTAAEARLFGRRDATSLEVAELFDEAADVAEVTRRLWDSWEGDAVIRDVSTGRYLDRTKIHGAEFESDRFSVVGASIVPRSPQGQLPVTVLAHRTEPYELAAKAADLVYVTPRDEGDAARILDEVRDAERRVGRTGEPLRVYADLVVVLEATTAGSRKALERLDAAAGTPLTSDALVEATTVDGLVELVREWGDLGYDGFRLRPARLPADLTPIAEKLIPALVRAGLRHPTTSSSSSLRDSLGLPAATNRHSTRTEVVA